MTGRRLCEIPTHCDNLRRSRTRTPWAGPRLLSCSRGDHPRGVVSFVTPTMASVTSSARATIVPLASVLAPPLSSHPGAFGAILEHLRRTATSSPAAEPGTLSHPAGRAPGLLEVAD